MLISVLNIDCVSKGLCIFKTIFFMDSLNNVLKTLVSKTHFSIIFLFFISIILVFLSIPTFFSYVFCCLISCLQNNCSNNIFIFQIEMSLTTGM